MKRIAMAACAMATAVMFACADAGTPARDPGPGDVPEPASDSQDAAEAGEDPGAANDPGRDDDPGPACDGEPREGCPCSPDDAPCCLGLAEGLECGIALPLPRGGAPSRVWARFLDCGCDPGPDCEGWDLYPMCGTATR